MLVLQLCAHDGVNRTTRYEWIVRGRDADRQGLRERSRGPHGSSFGCRSAGIRMEYDEMRPHERLGT